MPRILFALFLLPFFFFSNTSHGQWGGNGSVGISTQYVGITQTVINDRPVAQISLHASENSGMYIDLFGTFGLTKQKGNEVDAGIGMVKTFDPFTVTTELASYTILKPHLLIIAPILRVDHSSGWYVGLEGRKAGNEKWHHVEIGYRDKWWNIEVRKVDFYGDNLTVARMNLSHKLYNDITASVTIATPITHSNKKPSVVLGVSKSF